MNLIVGYACVKEITYKSLQTQRREWGFSSVNEGLLLSSKGQIMKSLLCTGLVGGGEVEAHGILSHDS